MMYTFSLSCISIAFGGVMEHVGYLPQIVKVIIKKVKSDRTVSYTHLVHEGVAEAANTRAREIKSTFSHTRPDGSNFSTILTQAGISYRSVGENIAYGQNLSLIHI